MNLGLCLEEMIDKQSLLSLNSALCARVSLRKIQRGGLPILQEAKPSSCADAASTGEKTGGRQLQGVNCGQLHSLC